MSTRIGRPSVSDSTSWAAACISPEKRAHVESRPQSSGKVVRTRLIAGSEKVITPTKPEGVSVIAFQTPPNAPKISAE